MATLQEFLAGGRVDAAVFALRPDYRAMLMAADGIVPGRNAPATAWRRCCAGRDPGCPG